VNSRERVLRAVNFEKPDQVPIDLGATRASGINAVVYDRLKKRMGIHTPTKIHDSLQILAEVELEVLDRLHADVVPLEAATANWAPSALTATAVRMKAPTTRSKPCKATSIGSLAWSTNWPAMAPTVSG